MLLVINYLRYCVDVFISKFACCSKICSVLIDTGTQILIVSPAVRKDFRNCPAVVEIREAANHSWNTLSLRGETGSVKTA